MWRGRPWMNSEVSWILAYNRYTPPAWAAPRPRPQPRQQPRREAPGPARTAPADAAARPHRPAGRPGPLPAGLDAGDLFLAAMLLFLYSESHDEDFLIILIVVGLSVFQKK